MAGYRSFLSNVWKIDVATCRPSRSYPRGLKWQLSGPAHPNLAIILGNLAVLLRETGWVAEAEELKGKAKDVRQRHQQNNPD